MGIVYSDLVLTTHGESDRSDRVPMRSLYQNHRDSLKHTETGITESDGDSNTITEQPEWHELAGAC